MDICDLEKILKEGILPISKTDNDNWEYGNRSNNSKDVVYLFSPITSKNTFTQYGLVLLEVESDATQNNLLEYDVNAGLYEEYITKYVQHLDITKIYIPKQLKDRIVEEKLLSDATINKITFVDMNAKYMANSNQEYYQMADAPKKVIDLFLKTANLNTTDFNYFRGKDLNNFIIDLYNITYNI